MQSSPGTAPRPFEPPEAVASAVRISPSAFGTWPMFIVEPPTGRLRGTLLYLHGGGHVTELTPFHWAFIARLVLSTGWAVVVPVFPIAPTGTHRDVYPVLERLYAAHVAGEDRTAIVGDSSGGTLALALLQAVPAEQRPEHTVLLSPWLDAVLDNPEIPALEPTDPFSTRAGLQRGAVLFADGDDLAVPELSPVRGRLDHLGAITVFAATRDILTPDARLLARRAGAGTSVDVREYEGMTHAWMLLSEPAGAEVADEIHRILG